MSHKFIECKLWPEPPFYLLGGVCLRGVCSEGHLSVGGGFVRGALVRGCFVLLSDQGAHCKCIFVFVFAIYKCFLFSFYSMFITTASRVSGLLVASVLSWRNATTLPSWQWNWTRGRPALRRPTAVWGPTSDCSRKASRPSRTVSNCSWNRSSGPRETSGRKPPRHSG